MTDVFETTSVTGTISKLEALGKSKGGWGRFNVTLTDGKSILLLVQPDVVYEPKENDEIHITDKGQGAWIINSEKMGLTRDNSGDKPLGGSNSGRFGREDYWRTKDLYERTERDPKIEYQTYLKEVVTPFYVAAIPTLKDPIKTVEDLDRYIDDAVAKAQAIYDSRQTKKSD